MKKTLSFILVLTFVCFQNFSQIPLTAPATTKGGQGKSGTNQGTGGFNAAQMSIGRFYGKIVNDQNKPIPDVTIQLFGNVFDTVQKKMISKALITLLTEKNGDFSLENINLLGKFKLKISCVGYKTIQQDVSFNFKMPAGGPSKGFDFAAMASAAEKDLGNIKLETDVETLKDVTVSSSKPTFELGIDRKIFNVDKNLVSVGGTAADIMKNIPSLVVDADNNVTLRNETPTIFVDGRPTNLTIDQIPAEIIEKIEIISNPSAKYDAASGAGGIINIVLKKNRKKGINGTVNASLDSRLRPTFGGFYNYKTNKFNFSIIGNSFFRNTYGNTDFNRTDNMSSVPSFINSNTKNESDGNFNFARAGFDIYLDNRNTLSIYETYFFGTNTGFNNQIIDSNLNNITTSYYKINNNSDFIIQNLSTQISYKHNFKKTGEEFTADINYNNSFNDFNSVNQNSYFDPNNNLKLNPPRYNQKSYGNGSNLNLVFQTDYEVPFQDKFKLEAGLRYTLRNQSSLNYQSIQFPDAANSDYILISSISSNFKYIEESYAGYANFAIKLKSWNFQIGARLQNRLYGGNLITPSGFDTLQFKVDLPLQLFPSLFVTYKINTAQDLQFNYSRKLSPPNFFQLFPFPNYQDPQNISVGNPNLQPQYNNIFEINYNNAYKKGANFFASIYWRNTQNLISRYVYLGLSSITNDSVLFSSFINASEANTIGIELSNKINLFPWWEFTLSANLFNTQINTVASALNQAVNNQLFSWNAKTNNNFKLPKNFSIQLSADYYSRTILPPSSNNGGGGARGGGGGGGGFGFGGGVQSFANGYNLPRFVVDMGVRKDITFKNKNTLVITLSVSDLLRTQMFSSFIESPLFTQTSDRTVLQQYFRLSLRYQFGKFDLSTFKRKSNKGDAGDDQSQQVQQ